MALSEWKYWGESQLLPCPFCGEKMERVRLQATFGNIDDGLAALSGYDTSKGGKIITQECPNCGNSFESRLAPDEAALHQGASFHQWRIKKS